MDISKLAERLDALEREVVRLNDVEQIRKLRYTYCRSVNQGKWAELESCFAEDGEFIIGKSASFQGKKTVASFYRDQLSKTTRIAVVLCHNPEIVVSGTTAKARWEFDNFRVEAADDKASRTLGGYNEEYVKVDGVWKIRRLTVFFHSRQQMEWEFLNA